MRAAVKFGPITAVVIDYLAAFTGVPTSQAVPTTRPAAWLRVLRTGGPQVDVITEAAQLTIESWADSATVAEDNILAARYALQQMAGTTVDEIAVYRVDEFAGPAYLPDAASHQPRWTFTVSLRARGITPTGP